MIIYKFFALGEYEKKEDWINQMCLKGYALKDFNFCRFNFEKCKPGEYYYIIELLENLPSFPNQEDFLNYLEDEWNVEYVCHSRNWVFFRRNRKLGKFSLFSNVQSKVFYFKKILRFRFSIVLALLLFAILNIISSPEESIDETFALLLILIAIIVLAVNIPTFMTYNKLKKSDES